MNTVQNGKGDRPRNNWGRKWYAGYVAINWHHSNAHTNNNLMIDRSKSPRPEPLLRNLVKCESSQE